MNVEFGGKVLARYRVTGLSAAVALGSKIANPPAEYNCVWVQPISKDVYFGVDDSSFTIMSAVCPATTATITTSAAHGYVVGQTITITGTTNFNGSFVIVAVPATTTFTYATGGAIVTENAGTVHSVVVSATVGMLLTAGTIFFYQGSLKSMQFMESSASASLEVWIGKR